MVQHIMSQRLPLLSRFERRGHHAQPLTGIALHLRFPVGAVKGFWAVTGLLLCAEGKNHVRRAGDQDLLLATDLVVGTHVLVLRVERDFVDKRGHHRCKVGFRCQHLQRPFGWPAGDPPQAALVLNHLAVVTQIDGAQILL